MTSDLVKADKQETSGKQTRPSLSPLFENPFQMEDLLAFDDDALRRLLVENAFGVSFEEFATSVHGTSERLIRHILKPFNSVQRRRLRSSQRARFDEDAVQKARRHLLDSLFWELTYWKTPELYEELTEGEQLHPGIFQQLEPDVLRS